MKKSKKSSGTGNKAKEITDYDSDDVSGAIDMYKPLQFENLGLKLPKNPPTQVVSIRLPTALLNQIKAIGSQEDIPYQALIKLYLSNSIKKLRA